MLQTIINLSLCILIVGGVSLSIGVIRKDSKYIGNRLFSLSTAFLGCYGTCTIVYQLFQLPEVIMNLERWAYIFALLSTFCLFLSMQVIVHSRDWLTEKVHTVPIIIIIVLYIVALFSWPGIITIMGYAPVNTSLDTIFSIILGVLIFYFLFSSIFAIYKYGLHNVEPARKKKMQFAIFGLCVVIAAVVLNTLSDLVGDVVVGSIFDAIYFLTMCTGVVFVAIGFVGRAKGS